MSVRDLGHALVIANPASHSGKGAAAAGRVQRFFESYRSATRSFDLELTGAPLDAVEMASHSGGMDTVMALGGDGLIHEVVNGLMAIDARDRPRLGIIPMGSGNDFARTLGATFNDPDRALAEILRGSVRRIDLGLVTTDTEPAGPLGCGPGTYFMETLSFGIDAAIALDTVARRAVGTSQEGSTLFLTSSLKIVAAGSGGYACHLDIDDEEGLDLTTLVLAVQNGPTYGGGFRICPDAEPDDGMLDLCFNVANPSVPRLLWLLGLARFGLHVGAKAVRTRRARRLVADFGNWKVPCQVDGERLGGHRFEIEAVPQALDVIFPVK